MSWLKDLFGREKSSTINVTKPKELPSETGRLPIVKTLKDADRIAISPDGCSIAVGGGLHATTLDIMSISTGERICRWDANAFHERMIFIKALAFSPDGALLASGGANPQGLMRLFIWDMKSRKLKTRVDAHAVELSCLEFSPMGDRLASCGSDGLIKLWTPVGKVVTSLHCRSKHVNCIAFLPDDRTLVSAEGYVDPTDKAATQATEPGEIVFWDLSSGRNFASIPTDSLSYANAIAISPDGKTLAVGTGTLARDRKSGQSGRVQLFNLDTRTLIEELDGFNARVQVVTFSPGGTLLAAGTFHTEEVPSIRVWNLQTKKVLYANELSGASYYAIRFSPDGAFMFISPPPLREFGAKSVRFSQD